MNWVIMHNHRSGDGKTGIYHYDDVPLFWNNDDGWGPLSAATVFSDSEQNEFIHLPIESWGWVELPPLSVYP